MNVMVFEDDERKKTQWCIKARDMCIFVLQRVIIYVGFVGYWFSSGSDLLRNRCFLRRCRCRCRNVFQTQELSSVQYYVSDDQIEIEMSPPVDRKQTCFK